MIEFFKDYQFDPEALKELSNQKAEWRLVDNPNSATTELHGYGGECVLVVVVSGMQSGKSDIAIIRLFVDSPLVVEKWEGIPWGQDHNIINQYLTRAMEDPEFWNDNFVPLFPSKEK